jgi:hypothetical protein
LHLFSQPSEFERRKDSLDGVEKKDGSVDIDIAETGACSEIKLVFVVFEKDWRRENERLTSVVRDAYISQLLLYHSHDLPLDELELNSRLR